MSDEPQSRPTGRPSDFTQDIADAICERLMDGASLKTICNDPEMPARSTVYAWLNKNRAFNEQYERARRVQFDTWADETKDIADTPEEGIVTTDCDGEITTKTADMVEHRKLRVHARQWLLGRLDARFKDKNQTEHTGVDGAPLVPVINLTVGGGSAT
jgi:hypothetical protein